jgi:hypothetical protein
MNRIVKILIERDGMDKNDAKEIVDAMKGAVECGANPEKLLQQLGLEPDYIFDLF